MGQKETSRGWMKAALNGVRLGTRYSAFALRIFFPLLFSGLARAEFSQELSLHLNSTSSNGYHLVDNEKKPLTQTQSKVHLSYGYFLSENIEFALRYSLDDSKIKADEASYHIVDQETAAGFILNLPDGAKGYAISTSNIIPYIGILYNQKIYPDQEKLYLLSGSSAGVEFVVGLRYFLFQRIAWNMWARASTFSQAIQTKTEDETSKGFREGTEIEVQVFGLSFLW